LELKLGIWIIASSSQQPNIFMYLKKLYQNFSAGVFKKQTNAKFDSNASHQRLLKAALLWLTTYYVFFAANRAVWVWDPGYILNDYFQLCLPVVPTSRVTTVRSRPARRSPSTALRSSPSRRQSSTFTSMTKMLVKPVRIFKM
jgi:hypothetical protein